MKKSEKTMLIAFLGLLGVFGVIPAIWSGLSEPIETAEQQLEIAETRLADANKDHELAMKVIRDMKAYKERSLSSNPSQAAHAYQQWLSDLTEVVAEFDDPEVTPDRISTGKDDAKFSAIRVRVSGEGTLEQLQTFLYRFHRANVLHRIASLNIVSDDSSSSPLLEIDMSIEALSLKSAPEKPSTTLFPRSQLLSVTQDGELEVIHFNTFTPTPFEVRVGGKYVNVIERKKQFWDLEGDVPQIAAGEKITMVPPKAVEQADDKKSDEDATAKTDAKAAPKSLKPIEAELLEDVQKGEVLITVIATSKFPAAPFEIKIGGNIVKVTRRTELWVTDNDDLRPSKGAVVELSPVHPDFVDAKLDDFDTLIAKNPFSKPVRERPVLDLIGVKEVKRGSSTTLTPMATGYDKRPGNATYEIMSDLPDGMTFEKGKLQWSPPTDMKAGKFEVGVKATAPGLSKAIEKTFSVELIDANDAPDLDVPEDIVATIGQPMTVQVLASDTETPDDLTYGFGEGAPAGASIDAKTGIVTWTPPTSSQPGVFEIPITVTDVGVPQQMTSAKLVVTLQDDVAQFTFLTAFVGTDADQQAWLYDRSTDKRIVLRLGGRLNYAGFDGAVTGMGREFVDIKQGPDTWRIEVGKSLRDALLIKTDKPLQEKPKPAAATTEPADPTTKPSTKPADAATKPVTEPSDSKTKIDLKTKSAPATIPTVPAA